MKAKLKNRDTDGLGLTPEKWYDVLDVECHGEKGRFGEVKKVLIQSEKKRDPEWYKAEYFILAAEAQAYADNQAAAGAAQPASLIITTRNACRNTDDSFSRRTRADNVANATAY